MLGYVLDGEKSYDVNADDLILESNDNWYRIIKNGIEIVRRLNELVQSQRVKLILHYRGAIEVQLDKLERLK
jgi:hypothetical protein